MTIEALAEGTYRRLEDYQVSDWGRLQEGCIFEFYGDFFWNRRGGKWEVDGSQGVFASSVFW